ncbi:LUD domain-containing protein [Parasphingorhabdus pacifica]
MTGNAFGPDVADASNEANSDPPRHSPASRFATALGLVGGCCHPVTDLTAAGKVVADLCEDGAVITDRDVLIEQVVGELRVIANPWAADVGLTTALVAVADTGSLAMVYDRDHPRSNSLVPPVHVAVVPASRLVDSYADAIDRLAAVRPVPSGMQLITGPSSSGDIEMVQVRGMHGPLAMHVVLVTAS